MNLVRGSLAGFCFSALALGVPYFQVFILVVILAITDVTIVFLKTDIAQTFIREKEITKRHKDKKAKKNRKKNHKG